MQRIGFAEAAAAIIECGRRVYESGLVAGNDGNISVRLDENEVLMTPTGQSKGALTGQDLVLLDMQGNVLQGRRKPTSEWELHLQVYANDGRQRGVLHAHSPYASAFAAAGETLPENCRLAEVTECLGYIPLLAFAAPGSRELAAGVGRTAALQKYNGALLESHGPVLWGESLTQAAYRLEELELACKIEWLSRCLKRLGR